jgi:hypothetical protein
MVVGVVCLVALVVGIGSPSGAATSQRVATRSAPKLADPTATAQKLVNRFFVLIQEKDVAGLKKFLSPAFQLERADGTGTGRADYLANLPTLSTFEIASLTAEQSRSVLVARYLATATGLVNGKPYTPGPAPRLSVFTWTGSSWAIAAHANFNPLTG